MNEVDAANPNWPTYIFCVEGYSAIQAENVKKEIADKFPYANIVVTNARIVYRFPPENK